MRPTGNIGSLTDVQVKYLRALATGADMRPFLKMRYNQTRRAMLRRGYVSRRPVEGHGGRRWEITDGGRAALVAHDTIVKGGG